MTKQKVAALDVDGVLLNFDHSFAIVAEKTLGRPMRKLNAAYDLRKRYGLTQDEINLVWEEMKIHPNGWRGMLELEGARESFATLREMGYRIELVTAISKEFEQMRLDCLAQYGMIPDGIHCVGGHDASKIDVLRELAPELIVDDRLSHLLPATFIPHRVWVDHGDDQDGLVVDENIYRVTSLASWVAQWQTPSVKRSCVF